MHSSAQVCLKAHGGGPPSCVLGVHSIGWFMPLIAQHRLGASLRLVSLARWPLSTPLGWATSEIGTKRTSQPYRRMSAFGGKAEVGVGQLDFRV
jgi:hypothetical protein